ncbi:MAG: tRNA (adenosine(37)-N6)-threonylcarbamoyltransferase complex ATPase subunit type 1 TsaE [Chitinophagaceae bacterium]|nr:tRNA (adenosine(37)-N6)-threonylcarbamoyltransferase complex ATPase subunit type 1 TsaE [Chitinophagaceae bacterium]
MEVNFTLERVKETAAMLLDKAANYKVFAFHGEMGAGKTTFIHALCELMGVQDVVTSPTFSIINQYKTNDTIDPATGALVAGGQTIYHMDLYRIRDENEALNAGIEDCLYSGNICFVEWPGKAPGIFPDETLHIEITSVNDNTRKLKINL